MESYKIQVNNEAESKEVQELFFELGYSWPGCVKYYNNIGSYTFIAAYPDEMLLRWRGDTDKELTLPQLRDLVVLKRNDVKDANVYEDTECSCLYNLYLTADRELYFYHCGKEKWIISSLNHDEDYYATLKPIKKSQPQDPALISGAEALRALADGKEVEFKHDTQGWVTCLGLNIERVLGGWHQMRLKPQTIKVELELPKPFEPKDGETFYYLNDGEECGFVKCEHDWAFDPKELNFGAYRTEEEIKQVVEQLRKIKGAV